MGLDLQQRIAQVQQKIGAKDAAGQNTGGLLKKLAKLLNKLGAANTVAGAAVTLGIASFVIPSGAASSGGPDSATPPGTSVGSGAGGGLAWGVTVGDDSPTPGDAGTDNPGTTPPDQGSSGTPADPGVAPPDSGIFTGSSVDGSSTAGSAGSGAGGSTSVEDQGSQSGGGGWTGLPSFSESNGGEAYEVGE
jgi:hypothetical protein